MKNGLLPVVVDEETLAWLFANPGVELEVDVSESRLLLPDGRSVPYPIDNFARYCLLEGIDQMGYLRQQLPAIEAFEENRSWTP